METNLRSSSLASLDDAALVARCREHDEEAWGQLVDRFSRYVFAICSRAFSLPPETAEDVFQEVFARTFERLEELRDESAIRPWIGQMTRRLCIDQHRSGRREVAVEEIDLGGCDAEIETLEDALTVRAALGDLPEHCGEILDRFFARDQSYATIGDELGIPSGTIASRISRCLAKLRLALEGRSEPPAASGATG